MRGGKRWFAIESMSFEVSVKEARGKIRGTIVERSKGLSSQIRFGVTSLRNFLEGLEECCREERKGRLAKVWEEEGRKFKVERRENGAGRYILCSVIDVESKRFCLVVPEGKGILGGWALFAEKLWELGVATQDEVKVKEASRGESKSEGVLIENKEESCIEKKAMGGKKSYADVTKESAGMQGDALWLQVGGGELRNREKGLGRCLVGRWRTGSVGELELQTIKKWGEQVWNLRKGLRMLSMGRPLMMLEFEDEEDAERTLKRVT